MKRVLFLNILLLYMLVSCSSPGETTSRGGSEPTNLPAPTQTPLPPEPSPTLDPIVFVDRFDDGLDSSWTWLNENPDRWMVTSDGWLVLTAEDPSVLSSGQEIQQVNLLVQPAPEGDFTITTRLIADPKENFQQAGIFLILDGINYVSILNAFCQPCLASNGGYGIFMEAYKNNQPLGDPVRIPRPPDQKDGYLRLVYSAAQKTVTGYYASAPDDWQQVGVIQDVPTFYQVGLGAANVPGPEGVQVELQASYDYFEIARIETPARAGSPPPQPSATPEPTATLEPTPLPEGVLFRDDFENTLQPGWTWLNQEPDRWHFTTDGWLEITGGNTAFYFEDDFGMTNFLTRELPQGDFVITAHVQSNPTENFQQAAIYIYQDQNNYIALNLGYCSICSTNGPGFFMETFIDNNPGEDAYPIPRDPAATDVYLRLVNQGGSVTGYYATTPGEWQRVGAFGNFFDFELVGLGTTNSQSGGVRQDIVSRFDYFEITLPE